MRLRIPKHSTKLFSWHPDDKIFLSEASSLGRPMAGNVWDDACDIGFELVSEKTEKPVLVTLTKELRNADGEIVSWEFRPMLNTPERDKFMIKVFND